MRMIEKNVSSHSGAPSIARMSTGIWILVCAAVITFLDLAFAITWWLFEDVAPTRVMQSIASWVIGREAALSGGVVTVVFGVLLHFSIMALIATIYFLLGRRIARLRLRPLRWGAAYGCAVFVIQYLVIVPYFSAATPTTTHVWWSLACLVVYALLVGIPCALFMLASDEQHAHDTMDRSRSTIP